MNWYKASAITNYMQIGQTPSAGKPVYLWWWDGSFHVQPTDNPNWGHREVVPNYNDLVCRGRFDPATNQVSLMAMKGIPPESVAAIKSQWPTAEIRVFRER